jgi:hypothetical protein
MNTKVKKVLQGILFVLIIIAFIYVGTRDFNTNVVIDNEKFDADYSNVDKDNVFVYVNAAEVYSKLKSGNAIIFMGYPQNKWSGYYANILNTAAKESNISEILYYDFLEDRNNKNGTYQSIVLKLSSYVPTIDDGTQDIYAPTLVIVSNGKIIAYDNETAINIGNITPDDYWNEYRTGIKLNNFKTMFQEYLTEVGEY